MFGIRSRFTTPLTLAAIALVATACEKDPTSPAKVAAGNLTLPITAANVAAIAGKTFYFSNGGGLSPTLANQRIGVTFNVSGTATTAAITTPSGTIQTNVTFGSCIFTVTSSGILAVNFTLTVNPCSLNLNTAGLPANGTTVQVDATMIFPTSFGGPSETLVLPISISSTGEVTVMGVVLGTVTLTTITGTT